MWPSYGGTWNDIPCSVSMTCACESVLPGPTLSPTVTVAPTTTCQLQPDLWVSSNYVFNVSGPNYCEYYDNYGGYIYNNCDQHYHPSSSSWYSGRCDTCVDNARETKPFA